MCNALVRKWQHALQIPQPVECIFEKGDFGQGQFNNLMRDEGADDPIFKQKDEYAGLQAADHYAWEQAFFLKKELQGKQSPERADFTRAHGWHTCHIRTGRRSSTTSATPPLSGEDRRNAPKLCSMSSQN
jgi:hypothetical protein